MAIKAVWAIKGGNGVMRAYIDRIISGLIFILMIVMLCCVVWQVVSRYIIRSPSVITEEVSRFGLIWLGLLGAGYVTGLRRHLAIDIITANLTGAKKYVVDIVIELMVLLFAGMVLMYGGWDLVSKTFSKGQVSPVLHLKMGWVYLAIPVCGVLIAYYTLICLWNKVNASGALSNRFKKLMSNG